MNNFVAIDPGKRKIGAAIFKGGKLAGAALFVGKDLPNDPGERWARSAGAVHDMTQSAFYAGPPDLVYEMMQNDGRTEGAKITSVMDLCGVTGALALAFRGRCKGYTPSEWNEGRSKGPNHAKILRALDDTERSILFGASHVMHSRACGRKIKDLFQTRSPKIATFDQLYERAVDEATGDAEHTLDAIGIGLFHLGRLR